MTRSRALFFLVSALLVLFIVGGSLWGASGDEGDDGSLYKYLSVFTEALSLVQQAYVDDVDMETLMAGALDSATEALDPFSLYLPADEVEPYLKAREVGVRLSGLMLLKERGIAFVASVEPGSPADEAGILVSDIVTDINGENTRVMPVWEIQEILGGEPGSKVRMSVLHQGDRDEVELTLGTYQAPTAHLEKVDGAPVLRVGTLRPANLQSVRAGLEQAAAERVGGLVLDLRGVAGGDPETAYRMAGLFTQGELGILNRRGLPLKTFSSDAEPLWRGRLVVLVSRGTLGAAEVLARVLQEKAEAKLVGERTFGYTGRQDIAELPSGGRLIYTDAFYTGPDREVPEGGLEPDERVSYTSRSFDERDLPIRELILQRGIRLLLEDDDEEEPQREAA